MLRMDMVTERRNRTMNEGTKIKELVQTLNHHRHAYYNRNAPEISDAEYDRMYDQLKELEEETGIIYSNSPTQTGASGLSRRFSESSRKNSLADENRKRGRPGTPFSRRRAVSIISGVVPPPPSP